MINERGPYNLFLDTGAGKTIVSHEVAEELGLEIVGTETRRGVGGEVELKLARIDSFSIDGPKADLETIGISDVTGNLCGKAVVGNLGYDLFQKFRLDIDYAGAGFSLNSSSAVPANESVDFRLGSTGKPLIMIDVTVGDRGPYTFALDTGAGATVIAPKLADELALEKGEIVQCAGVGGIVDGQLVSEPVSVQLGTTTNTSIKPLILDIFNTLSKDVEEEFVGILGHDVLSQHHLTIDYPSSLLWLQEVRAKSLV